MPNNALNVARQAGVLVGKSITQYRRKMTQPSPKYPSFSNRAVVENFKRIIRNGEKIRKKPTKPHSTIISRISWCACATRGMY